MVGHARHSLSERYRKKIPVVAAQAMMILVIAYVTTLSFGLTAGWLTGFILASNPVLLAHTKIYGTDSIFSLFVLLSLALLLAWHKQKQTRYLVAAGAVSAGAILTKIPGIVLVPLSLVYVFAVSWRQPISWRLIVRWQLKWLISCVAALIILLPSLVLNFRATIGTLLETFSSDDFVQVSGLSQWYYLGTIFFYSTPLQWLGLALGLTGALLIIKRGKTNFNPFERLALILLIFFGLGFVFMMSMSNMKSDRYLLPVLVVMDLLAAYSFSVILDKLKCVRTTWLSLIIFLMLSTAAWQWLLIVKLTPDEMAYVNPLTRIFFGERRSGWGEGLEIAASYLNTKPKVENIKVATYYPNEFGHYFKGDAMPAHRWEDADYVIIYRAMFQRGQDAWETDVVKEFRQRQSEKVLRLAGLDMVWIYKR